MFWGCFLRKKWVALVKRLVGRVYLCPLVYVSRGLSAGRVAFPCRRFVVTSRLDFVRENARFSLSSTAMTWLLLVPQAVYLGFTLRKKTCPFCFNECRRQVDAHPRNIACIPAVVSMIFILHASAQIVFS